jgi:hypothetical protein
MHFVMDLTCNQVSVFEPFQDFNLHLQFHVALLHLIQCCGQLPFIYREPDSHFQPAKTAWLKNGRVGSCVAP